MVFLRFRVSGLGLGFRVLGFRAWELHDLQVSGLRSRGSQPYTHIISNSYEARADPTHRDVDHVADDLVVMVHPSFADA